MHIRSHLPSSQMLLLCLATLCWGYGFGVGAPLASLWLRDWLQDAEFSKTVIESLRADSQAMVSMDKALLLALYKKLKGANQKIERLMLT